MITAAFSIGALLNSCKEEKMIELIIPTRVSFSSNAYLIEKTSSQGTEVTLHLTRPLEAKGAVEISIDHNTTADNTEYTLTPEPVSGKISLNLQKGDSTASFTITSAHNFEDDKTVGFTIDAASGALLIDKANTSTIVTLQGNKLVPQLTASVFSLDDFGEVDKGTVSASQSYTLSGKDLTENVVVTASENFKVSLDNVTFSSSQSIDFNDVVNGLVSIYVQFAPNTGINQALWGSITHSSGGVTNTITLSGTESGNVIVLEPLLLEESFDYGTTPGNLTSASGGNWDGYSGAGLSAVKYIVPGLSFPGYAGGGKGGASSMEGGSGSREDVRRTFAQQTSGTVYTAQLINIPRSTTNEFFYSLRDDNGGFFNRIYAKDDGSGNLILSLGRNTTPDSSPTPYTYDTTYLIITKYDFSSQVSSMYVISGAIPDTEPAVPDVITSGGTAPANLTEVVIRQAGAAQEARIDEIRIGTSWESILRP